MRTSVISIALFTPPEFGWHVQKILATESLGGDRKGVDQSFLFGDNVLTFAE